MQSIVFQNSHGETAHYYLVRKGNPTIFLIPGSFDDQRYWAEVAQLLPQHYGVTIAMLPGHGQSVPTLPDMEITDYVGRMLEIAEHQGIGALIAGGHSIGGMCAIEMIRQTSKIIGCISCEGWSHHTVAQTAFAGNILGVLSGPERERYERSRREAAKNFTLEERCRFSTIWTRWNGWDILKTARIPILELWGDRGMTMLPSWQQLQIPQNHHISLQFIKDAGHCLPLQYPKKLAAAITEWLVKNDL